MMPATLVTDIDEPNHGGSALDHTASVDLLLDATAEDVVVAREVAALFARMAGLDEERIHDVKLATSEAATNVAVHAYEGGRGPLGLTLSMSDDSLCVLVRDAGNGLRPNPDGQGLGVGLPLMGALADRLDLRMAEDGMFEAVMMFPLEPRRAA